MESRELVARRLALGLSQQGLAQRLAVAQATISRWEANERRIPATIDIELAALEDQVESELSRRLRADDVTLPADPTTDVLGAVAAARALVARRRRGTR